MLDVRDEEFIASEGTCALKHNNNTVFFTIYNIHMFVEIREPVLFKSVKERGREVRAPGNAGHRLCS